MANGNEPYVMYRLRVTDAIDKGIVLAIKRSTTDYLKAQGIQGICSVQRTDSSSGQEAIIKLYDGGKPDFNQRVFLNHLRNCGRLPGRGEKLEIEVVKPESDSGKKTKVHNFSDPGYQKMAEKISEQDKEISSLTRTTKSLTSSLDQRQKTIDENNVRIADLEKRLHSSDSLQYDSPVIALLKGYVRKPIDELFSACNDWDALISNGDQEVFLKSKGFVGTYVDYFNEKYGVNLRSEKDIGQWKRDMENCSSWGQTKESQRLKKKSKEVKEIEGLLASARKISSVNKHVTGQLESTLSKLKDEANRESLIADRAKSEFNKAREKYGKFGGNTMKAYEQLRQVIQDSSKRKAELPIIVSYEDGKDPKIKLYMPSIGISDDGNGGIELENHIEKVLVDSLELNSSYSAKTSILESDEEIKIIEVKSSASEQKGRSDVTLQQKKDDFKGFNKRLQDNLHSIMKDPILNALGLNPKVLTITGSM